MDDAVLLSSESKYVGLGTVEFLVDEGSYYFMEMNTRLQVEHSVTEMVTGLDLVELQLKVSQRKSIEDLRFEKKGHAIELRILSENPYKYVVLRLRVEVISCLTLD